MYIYASYAGFKINLVFLFVLHELFIDEVNIEQYLCTGLDIYLNFEPNLVAAMGLLHSRIRRVFYVHSDPIHGAFEREYKIHSMRELNHRFRVFRLNS